MPVELQKACSCDIFPSWTVSCGSYLHCPWRHAGFSGGLLGVNWISRRAGQQCVQMDCNLSPWFYLNENEFSWIPRNCCCAQYKTWLSLAVAGPEFHKQFWIKLCLYVIINQPYFGVLLFGFNICIRLSAAVFLCWYCCAVVMNEQKTAAYMETVLCLRAG